MRSLAAILPGRALLRCGHVDAFRPNRAVSGPSSIWGWLWLYKKSHESR